MFLFFENFPRIQNSDSYFLKIFFEFRILALIFWRFSWKFSCAAQQCIFENFACFSIFTLIQTTNYTKQVPKIFACGAKWTTFGIQVLIFWNFRSKVCLKFLFFWKYFGMFLIFGKFSLNLQIYVLTDGGVLNSISVVVGLRSKDREFTREVDYLEVSD